MRTKLTLILTAVSILLFSCREDSVLPTEGGGGPVIIGETPTAVIPPGTWESYSYANIGGTYEAKIRLEVEDENSINWYYLVRDERQPVETTVKLETTVEYTDQFIGLKTVRVPQISFIMQSADLLVYHPYFKIINDELHIFYGEIYTALDPIDDIDMISNKWDHNLNFFLYNGDILTRVRYIENIEFQRAGSGKWFRQYFSGPISFNPNGKVIINPFSFTNDAEVVRLGKDTYSRQNVTREYEIEDTTLKIHDSQPAYILRRVTDAK